MACKNQFGVGLVIPADKIYSDLGLFVQVMAKAWWRHRLNSASATKQCSPLDLAIYVCRTLASAEDFVHMAGTPFKAPAFDKHQVFTWLSPILIQHTLSPLSRLDEFSNLMGYTSL